MGVFSLQAMSAEIKGEVGQTLFEFLHMELLSYFMEAHSKDEKVNEC